MPTILIKADGLERLLRSMGEWSRFGVKADVDRAGKTIAKTYKSQIKAGLDGAGNPMKRVTEDTMQMPIRMSSDKAIRGEVRSSTTPLYARGHTAGSIKSSRAGKDVVIEPKTRHGRVVLGYNANSAKTKRDPLIVSDIQGKIIEDELLKGIDNALRR